MKFKQEFFKNYLEDAPLPLALERSMECNILSTKEFNRPILDIGCGEGIFAHNLFAEKVDVGIDPNTTELERAKHYDAYNELIECKGNAVPKEDGVFNTIFSNSVMEHIPEIENVLAEAHRLLSNNGKMYLTLPTNLFDHYTFIYQILKKLKLNNLQQKYHRFFNNFWQHYHYYDQQKWQELFAKHGFKVVNCQEYGSKYTCMINAAMSPLSIVPFITKKVSNKWFVYPMLRRKMARILHFFFRHHMKNIHVQAGKGGLIFFELIKNDK